MAKQNVSAIVSGMGVALALVDGICKRVRKLGGTDEDIHRLVTDDGTSVLDEVAKLIAGAGCKATNFITAAYRVLVDRTKSLADQITAGRYDWVNPDITVEHFPTEKGAAGEEEIALFHFDRVTNSDEAEAKMDKAGYRPVDVFELAAFAAAQPELQRQFPIITLGSVWQNPSGNRYVAYLNEWNGKRKLNLNLRDNDWNENCRFTAVRNWLHSPRHNFIDVGGEFPSRFCGASRRAFFPSRLTAR